MEDDNQATKLEEHTLNQSTISETTIVSDQSKGNNVEPTSSKVDESLYHSRKDYFNLFTDTDYDTDAHIKHIEQDVDNMISTLVKDIVVAQKPEVD